jgi:ribosome-associated toxin RatA of RatAB toxin-antitoxin module
LKSVSVFAGSRARLIQVKMRAREEDSLELSRSVLVPYRVEAMFDLIEQAEAYPQFLPWCTGATIFERADDCVAARLEFCYLGFRFGFRTRNAKCRPEWLQVRLVEGPFRRFRGDWRLTRLGDLGCKITFDVSYEISDGLLDRLAAPAVEFVSRSMMDAFVKRAEATLAFAAPLPAVASGVSRAPGCPPVSQPQARTP